MKDYYFIIVNYNGAEDSIACINSLMEMQTLSQIHIIVVDNNSDLKDKNAIKFHLKNIGDQIHASIIELGENIGYFGALNQGIRQLNVKTNAFVVVGNNDLIFPRNFCKEIESQSINEGDYVIAPDIITIDGIHQNPYAIKRISLLRRLSYKLLFSNYYLSELVLKISILLNRNRTVKNKVGFDKKQYIWTGFGACYILTPFFFKKNNDLLNLVFLNGEEPIFSHQIRSTGGKILYCPDIKVHHKDHSSFKKIGNRRTFEISKKSYKIWKKYV